MYLEERKESHGKHSKTENPERGRQDFFLLPSRWRRLRRFVALALGTVEGLPGGSFRSIFRSITSSLDDLLLDVFRLDGAVEGSAKR